LLYFGTDFEKNIQRDMAGLWFVYLKTNAAASIIKAGHPHEQQQVRKHREIIIFYLIKFLHCLLVSLSGTKLKNDTKHRVAIAAAVASVGWCLVGRRLDVKLSLTRQLNVK
jgi:hypothetical protein